MGKQHEICFINVQNHWDTALPVGNGTFGAMVFFEKGVLHIAVNDYDCYYRALPGRFAYQKRTRPVATYEELCRKADEVRRNGGSERSHYVRTLHGNSKASRPRYQGTSDPLGGEVLLELDERVALHQTSLRLNIEEAEITFKAGTDDVNVTAVIRASRTYDGLLLELTQSHSGLWKERKLLIPPAVGIEPSAVSYQENGRMLCMKVVYGQEQGQDQSGSQIQELVFDAETLSDNRIAAAVCLKPGSGAAESLAKALLQNRENEIRIHQRHWNNFWSAKISLPDELLERLWYLHLYVLESSSGRGGRYAEQACGLSGLWDIRHPNMWGSMWYWDVNIQSSFWGCGNAGHLELLKGFCDGYLMYQEDIYEYTRRVYGKEGWALDYPHTLYHSIQPWCAQFLWKYYQLSGDRDFLKQKAYPVFRQQIAFFEQLSVKDEQGVRHIEYDVSPEQGPVTKDSVITISCIRKLLAMAVEAAVILGESESEIQNMKTLQTELPLYPITADGSRYKDSLLVQDSIFLRHPSMMMPIFPAEELDFDLKPEERMLWENALSYAADHMEVVPFGVGWLAAAAAKLGRGQTALRLLYEKGVDHMIHANGLAYEESERFLNYCHLTKPTNYLPVMMEFGGGLVNAVNQMLIQTGNHGEIRIFPAVPEGDEGLLNDVVQYLEDRSRVEGGYVPWDDVRFEGLLVSDGFRVSAQRKEGKTVYLKVESSRDACLRLILPKELQKRESQAWFETTMKAGECLCWGKAEELVAEAESQQNQPVLCRIAARTHRRIFLGADRHTAYCQAVDGFTCGYLLANHLRYLTTPYIFDFGVKNQQKTYDDSYPLQIALASQTVLYSGAPRMVGSERYTHKKGYGFVGTTEEETEVKDGMTAVLRDGPDDLRRDFLEGTQDAVFAISLPKGIYEFLLISGDECEASQTRFTLNGHGTTLETGLLSAGEYSCKILPLVQEEDGTAEVRIQTSPGRKWKLNALFVKKEYAFTL